MPAPRRDAALPAVRPAAVPRQVPRITAERLNDEVLLYNPATEHVVRLNQTAALVWELCDGRRTAGQIVAMLEAAFPGTSVAADVRGVLERLAAEQLIAID
jgi:coenzyme PQQ biosynthesis protein PqqD